MKIMVSCKRDNNRKEQIIKAINAINAAQSYFYLELEDNSEVDICESEFINWKSICEEHTLETEEYVIYITDKPFDDNWFSHEESKFAVITTNSWEEIFAPPSLKSYLVYQMAQAAISFEGGLNEKMEMKMVHNSAEGCMFDFCKYKKDILLGMIAGNICPACRGTLLRYGVCEEALKAIESMLYFVRMEAIGKPIIFDEDAAFVVMRFSENDENDNAYKYGIKAAIDFLKMKCVRADSVVSSGQLLDKICRDIERSRFVIVKVDSNNLNVYFELGLAMGLNKDILLISEEQLVLQLPSDLRNWECLTYTKGNYDELKEKIINYYRDNYHYD